MQARSKWGLLKAGAKGCHHGIMCKEASQQGVERGDDEVSPAPGHPPHPGVSDILAALGVCRSCCAHLGGAPALAIGRSQAWEKSAHSTEPFLKYAPFGASLIWLLLLAPILLVIIAAAMTLSSSFSASYPWRMPL